MKTKSMQVFVSLLAATMLFGGCDEQREGDDAAAQDSDDEAESDEYQTDRLICLYNSSTPPLNNDTATLVGAVNEVESEDYASGGCDLHMFRVTASPPASRARTISFGTSSFVGFDDVGARVWTRPVCAPGVICPVTYTSTGVTLTILPGYCNPGLGFCAPDIAFGTLELPANNNIGSISAGMRATDDDGDEVEVTITVSE